MMTRSHANSTTYWKTIISKIRTCATISIGIVLVFMILDGCQELSPAKLALQIKMKSSVDSIAQLYFDTGKGLNENESLTFKVSKSQIFRTLKFALPEASIDYLRFDPMKKEGIFELKSIRIVDEKSRTIQKINLDRVKPLHQIERYQVENNIAVGITTKNANDPMLYFDIRYPIEAGKIDYFAYFNKQTFKKLTVVFMLSFVCMLFAFFEDK